MTSAAIQPGAAWMELGGGHVVRGNISPKALVGYDVKNDVFLLNRCNKLTGVAKKNSGKLTIKVDSVARLSSRPPKM